MRSHHFGSLSPTIQCVRSIRNDGKQRAATIIQFKQYQTILVYLLLLALIPVVLLQIGVYTGLYYSRVTSESLADLEVARALSLSFDVYIRDKLREEQSIGLAIITLLNTQPRDVEPYLIANAAEYPAIDSFFWINPQGQVRPPVIAVRSRKPCPTRKSSGSWPRDAPGW